MKGNCLISKQDDQKGWILLHLYSSHDMNEQWSQPLMSTTNLRNEILEIGYGSNNKWQGSQVNNNETQSYNPYRPKWSRPT